MSSPTSSSASSTSDSASSSRSSVISDRLYSPDMLFQLANTNTAQKMIGASATLLQERVQRFAAEILVDDSSSSFSSSDDSDNEEESREEEEFDDDDGFVYGEGQIRGDLSSELVEELRTALHQVLKYEELDGPLQLSPAATSVDSFEQPKVPSTNSTRMPRFVDNSKPKAIVHTSASFRQPTRQTANPGNFFGNPRTSNPATRGRAPPTCPSSRPSDRDSWRNGMRPAAAAAVRKDADSATTWRRLDSGQSWAWNEGAGGYVLVGAA